MPSYRRFYPIIDRRMVTCKKITLRRAGAGRTIPASVRRPTGFAGDPRGVYLRYPSRSFDMALMEQTSRKPVFGTVLEWFRRLAPNKFGSQPRLSWSMPGAGLEIAERLAGA